MGNNDPMPIDSPWWYFASERQRDRMLRGAVDDLEAQYAIHTASLRSDLEHLRGSFEQRLDALGRAFDAYVQLGDARERLSRLPLGLRSRPDALAAFDTLLQGERATPLDETVHDDWLARATNQLIGLVDGTVPPGPGNGDVIDEYLVCALLRLGRTDLLGGRMARLLAGKDALGPFEETLLWACALGWVHVDERRRVLAGCADAVAARTDWPTALRLDADLVRGTTWLAQIIHQGDARDGARDLSTTGALLEARRHWLIRAASDEERELQERIEVLRWRVEHPMEPEPRVSAPVPVAVVVERMILHPATDRGVRLELLRLVGEPVRGLVRGWCDEPTTLPLEQQTSISALYEHFASRAQTVTVTDRGPDPAELARARRAITEAPPGMGRGTGFLVGAGVLAVVGVVLVVLDQPWLVPGLAALVGAVMLGWSGVRHVRLDAAWSRESAEALAQFDADLAREVERLQRSRADDDRQREQAVARAKEMRAALGAATGDRRQQS